MDELIERVTKALREDLQKIGYGVGTINAGQLADAMARAAIEAITKDGESCGVCGCLVYKGLPTKLTH